MSERALTGNRAILKIDNQTVGFVADVTVTEQTEMQKLYGLGDIEAAELVPGAAEYIISGSKYAVSADALQGLGLLPNVAEWFTSPGLSVEIIDQKGGATLEHYSGCKFESHTRKYTKHAIVSSDFRIIARVRGHVSAQRQSQVDIPPAIPSGASQATRIIVK